MSVDGNFFQTDEESKNKHENSGLGTEQYEFIIGMRLKAKRENFKSKQQSVIPFTVI